VWELCAAPTVYEIGPQTFCREQKETPENRTL